MLASSAVHLRELSWIKPSYIVPRHDFVEEALIPCLQVASSYACMAGFFDSGAFRDLAPGLADFIGRTGSAIRLLASPYIDAADQAAIRDGVTSSAEVLAARLEQLCGEAAVSESALVRHTLACLSYLIASGRLVMRVGFVPGGLLHSKVWIFHEAGDTVVLHGSSNFTSQGLRVNVEQVSVARSWRDADQASVVSELVGEFEALWQGRREYAVITDLPEAVRSQLLRLRPSTAPTAEDFWQAWEEDSKQGASPGGVVDFPAPTRTGFAIPHGLEYETGNFAHQGRAVAAWETAGRRGILEMATGAGKTITAFICAQRLFAESHQLLLVIAAPYLPLVEQWRDEAEQFGLRAIVPNDTSNRNQKLAVVDAAVRRLRLKASSVEALVVSHDLLCDPAFQAIVSSFDGSSMLIGDECHNLGRESFRENPPEFFRARLGLSATPERQYDPEGTASLLDYFGPVVFEFTLAQAIGVCLVPYDYFVHPVELTEAEAHRYGELTEKLRRLGWTGKDQDSAIDDSVRRLLIRRRAVLEKAEGKVGVLRQQLVESGPHQVHHTLIYASAKGREQLGAVNQTLAELGIHAYQLTAEETARPKLATHVLQSFAKGELQVLTAMKVLDEGVNIPEIETAYIMASTTVEREWVQRRGRVLRTCAAIGKESASIHDFLVLPPSTEEADTRGLLRSELTRIREFGKLASNAAAPSGPLAVAQSIVNKYFG